MLNVDQLEINKFSELAASWWDTEGEFKALHAINPLRLEYISDQCNGLFDKHILDVGCGGGILAESMAKQGAKVIGIDLAEASLEVARLHGLESGVEVDYKNSSAETLSEQYAGKFDVITCMEMLEHVPDPESIVLACAKLVKLKGKVFFSTLNRNLKSWLLAIIAAERFLKLVPQGTHEYSRFIRPSELIGWLDKTDLIARDITGLHMNPLSGEFYLNPSNADVNYIVCCETVK
jgi:2-polyprenyl-6-hydroxyphenyl methylase/3-demethylubiquinone-9 3-methyltransferase